MNPGGDTGTRPLASLELLALSDSVMTVLGIADFFGRERAGIDAMTLLCGALLHASTFRGSAHSLYVFSRGVLRGDADEPALHVAKLLELPVEFVEGCPREPARGWPELRATSDAQEVLSEASRIARRTADQLRSHHLVAGLLRAAARSPEGSVARVLRSHEVDLATLRGQLYENVSTATDEPPEIWREILEVAPSTTDVPAAKSREGAASVSPSETGAAAETPVVAPAAPARVVPAYVLNDRPGGDDHLNYQDYVDALLQVVTSDRSQPPLVIGLYGSWGTGKSFLMERLEERLKGIQSRNVKTDAPATSFDIHCVRFNAWVYSGSETLWAGLITQLYASVEKIVGEDHAKTFRLKKQLGKTLRPAIYKSTGAVVLLLVLIALAAKGVDSGSLPMRSFFAQLVRYALGGTSLLALAVSGLPLFRSLYAIAAEWIEPRSRQIRELASRTDFREKIGFMADVKKEIGQVRELLEKGKNGRGTRLFVFIDDLDRCPPAKAVEVLEAVMLLLADDDASPFVVVLGIDARILVKAIEARYGQALTDAGVSGYEYLDKVVQIPFRIPAVSHEILSRYLSAMTTTLGRPTSASARGGAATAPAGPQGRGDADARTGVRGADDRRADDRREGDRRADDRRPTDAAQTAATAATAKDAAGANAAGANAAGANAAGANAAAPEEVSFEEVEREAFQAVTPYLSGNPRRVKRIVNIYRVLRILRPNLSATERRKDVAWVVLCEQWPFRVALLLQCLEDDRQSNTRRYPAEALLATVWEEVREWLKHEALNRLERIDGDPELFDGLVQQTPQLTAGDASVRESLAFNLNPAVQHDVVTVLRTLRGRHGGRVEAREGDGAGVGAAT